MENPKRVLIIYNPAAGPLFGRYMRKRRFANVSAILSGLGCKVTDQITKRAGDAEALGRMADPAEVDVVVAAGGDGTVNEVVNGLIGRKLPLGIIPLGTANLVAMEIGLSLRSQDIASTIAEGALLYCHPGLANERHFMMMAGVGFDAHVVETVSLTLKKIFGKGAYIWTTILRIIFHFPEKYLILVGGRSIPAASVVVGRGRFYGGRFSCTPDARLDRTTLQVCVFNRSGRWATILYILALIRGTLFAMPEVMILDSKTIRQDIPRSSLSSLNTFQQLAEHYRLV
jgi:diacylglycerol kinase (ATP)